MKKRLLCLGLLAAVSQLFATGCCAHPVARWRANHPCGVCGPCAAVHPLLHPVMTRRAVLSESGVAVGPVVTEPPCHGCGASLVTPGVPVGTIIRPGVTPTGYPAIGYPTPIAPGPTIEQSYPLPNPMPVKPGN